MVLTETKQCWGFIVGSAFFAVATVPGVAMDARTANLLCFIGAWFFTTAGLIQLRLSGGIWERDASGRRALSASWVTAVMQSVGTIMFNISTTSALFATTARADERFVWSPDAGGSVAFLVSGCFAFAAYAQSGRLWDSSSRDWWSTLINFAGCVAFGVSAVEGEWRRFQRDPRERRNVRRRAVLLDRSGGGVACVGGHSRFATAQYVMALRFADRAVRRARRRRRHNPADCGCCGHRHGNAFPVREDEGRVAAARAERPLYHRSGAWACRGRRRIERPRRSLALVAPVVECNRTQVDNGRTYFREMVFGDPAERHHADALSIVAQTEDAIAATLTDRAEIEVPAAATVARVVSAIMFLEMAASVNAGSSNQEILTSIRSQVAAILPGERS